MQVEFDNLPALLKAAGIKKLGKGALKTALACFDERDANAQPVRRSGGFRRARIREGTRRQRGDGPGADNTMEQAMKVGLPSKAISAIAAAMSSHASMASGCPCGTMSPSFHISILVECHSLIPLTLQWNEGAS